MPFLQNAFSTCYPSFYQPTLYSRNRPDVFPKNSVIFIRKAKYFHLSFHKTNIVLIFTDVYHLPNQPLQTSLPIRNSGLHESSIKIYKTRCTHWKQLFVKMLSKHLPDLSFYRRHDPCACLHPDHSD